MSLNNNLIWVEINKKNLLNNISELKKNLDNNTKFFAVVKSNGYGHNMIEIAKICLQENAVNGFCVNSLGEALELRENKITLPILVLGYISLEDLHYAIENDISFAAYNIETIKKCGMILRNLSGKNAKLHLKVETGTNRQGILKKDIPRLINLINKTPRVIIEGIYTHYANIEDTTDHSYATAQLNNFKDMAEQIESIYKNKNKIIKHTACSAAIILFKETYFDMVRAGIALYGLWPSKETYLSTILLNKKPVNLKPVLSWKTKIAQIKEINKNSFVSYGCTYKTARKTKLAILPVGYYDGYTRAYSNRSYVIIRNHRAPICGRVCMNMIVVDVTDIKGVNIEDEVILLGYSENEEISADSLAAMSATINYEVVTRINPKIKRIIV